MRNMYGLKCKYYTSSVFYSFLQEYIEKRKTLKFSNFDLFSLSRVISQSLYSICIGYRKCIEIYRHFSRTVRTRRSWLISKCINFNIHWLSYRKFLLQKFKIEENNIFANSLLNVTIQDSGKRKRSTFDITLMLQSQNLRAS